MAGNPFFKKLKSKDQPAETLPSPLDNKGHGDAGHDESNWLVSYADMMTLLCGFFIMMFSMAKLDEPEFEKVKEEVSKQFGGDYKSPSKELARFVTQVLQEAGIEKEVSVRTDVGGVSLIFVSTFFFDTLSAEIKPEGQKVLTTLISAVREREEKELKKYKVVVEGHTDQRPILSGAYPSNWELSGARAARVVRLFVENGFAPTRLAAIGYGDTRPDVITSRGPAGEWNNEELTKNRRVVIRILDPKLASIPFPPEPSPVPSSGASPVASPAGVMPVNSAH